MALSKQAKILSKHQQSAMLSFLMTTRHPERNCLIFLLSVRAGLRAKEVAFLTWGMVTDAEGNIGDAINLQDIATKGKSGGKIWLNNDLQRSLVRYKNITKPSSMNGPIITTERNKNTSAQVIVNMFQYWYKKIGYVGCTSHSGRRTFITNSARKISTVGGSIKDVQMLARHSSLQMTQRYIESDIEAQRKVVNII
jgi:integrase/recombinase XerD